MTFTYHMPDFTGNYEAVGEYWLKKKTECDFLSNQNAKLTWYSSDVSAKYQMYFDQGNFDCRPRYQVEDYPIDFPVVLGPDNNNACLVKFIVKNKNENHDLRI